MNKAALARAKEAAEAEAGRLRGELADSRGKLATALASAAAEKAAAGRLRDELADARAALAATEASLTELRAAVGAPPRLSCPALPAEVWAEVLGALGTRCACCPHQSGGAHGKFLLP